MIIIIEAFRIILTATLKIAFNLFSIRERFNLKLKIAEIYMKFTILNICFNVSWKYSHSVILLFLNSLNFSLWKIKKQLIHAWNTRKLEIEKIFSHIISLWWKLSITKIENEKRILLTHNKIKTKVSSKHIIYIDDSKINKRMKMIAFFFFNFKKFYLKMTKKFIVYIVELQNIYLILKLYNHHRLSNHKSLKKFHIFIDNQAVVRVVTNFKKESEQWIFKIILNEMNKVKITNFKSKLHWISAHVNVWMWREMKKWTF